MTERPPSRKPFRLVAYTLAVALGIGGALLFAAPSLVDHDALLQRIESEATIALGAPVSVDAIDELRLLPTPRLGLRGVQIDAAARTAVASVTLDLAPGALLLGQVEPTVLRATGIDLQWQSPPGPTRPALLAELSLDRIRVDQAELTLGYGPGARRLRWPMFGDGTGPLDTPAEADPILLTGTLPLLLADRAFGSPVQLTASIHPAGLPTLRIAPVRLSVDDLSLGELQGVAGEFSIATAERDTLGNWRLDEVALESGGLRLTAGAIAARRDARPETTVATDALSQIDAGPVVTTGAFSLEPLDLRAWIRDHGGPSPPGSASTWRCLAAEGQFESRAGQLVLTASSLRLDNRVAAAAATARLVDEPGVALVIDLDTLDLDAYLADATPSAAELSTKTDCVTSMTAEADEVIAGDAAPVALDRAPPPAPEAGVDLRLDLRAGAMKLNRLRYGDLVVAATQRRNRLETKLKADRFYGGAISARIDSLFPPRASAQEAAPRPTFESSQAPGEGPSAPRGASHRLDGSMIDVDLASMLIDLTGTPTLRGTAHLRTALSASGGDVQALRSSLAGDVEITVQDASAVALEQAAASFGPLLDLAGLQLDDDALRLHRLALTASGERGVFTTRDITGRAELFELSGTGQADLTSQNLDLALVTTLTQPRDGTDLQDLEGIQIPITIRGDWAAPGVSADLGPAVSEATKRIARRRLNGSDNLLEQLEDATGVRGLEEGLRGLFGL